MKTIILFGALTLFLLSCKKETPSMLDNYQGNYHLTYSEIEDSEFIVSTEMENDFGLTITSSNEIETFVNGKLLGIYEYRSRKYFQEEVDFNAFYFVQCNDRYSYIKELRLFSDGHIEFFDFPVKYKRNVFYP